MISRNPEQKRLYDSRLKFQRDEAARLEFARVEAGKEARMQGRLEGRMEGELIGQVRLLQQFLGLTQSTADELATLSSTELTRKVDDLQRQFRERGAI